MRALTHLALGFCLGILTAALLDPREWNSVALRKFKVSIPSMASVTLVNEELGERKTITDGDTLTLPLWKGP